MSIKVQQFANIITQPLNIHNYLVEIPGVDVSLLVESTTFPSEKMRIVELWCQGEKVRYPGLPENDGIWRIRVPESDDGSIQKQLDELKHKVYNQKTGTLSPRVYKNVNVFARDLEGNKVFLVTLHGCWLRGRDNVNLANNDPSQSWKWDYEFVYQWPEDKSQNNPGTPAPSM